MSKMVFSKDFNIRLATLFSIGKIPGGGTWASLIILLIALYDQSAETVSFIVFLTLILGPRAYERLVNNSKMEDPKEYVLDEVIGMGISLTGVYIFYSIIGGFEFNINFLTNIDILFILTFIIFRFFDISKIGPVGWVERNPNIKPYNKVVGDDIMAAILAILVVIIFLSVNLWIQQ